MDLSDLLLGVCMVALLAAAFLAGLAFGFLVLAAEAGLLALAAQGVRIPTRLPVRIGWRTRRPWRS